MDESASKEDDRKNFFAMLDYVCEEGIQDVVFDKVDRAVRGFKSAVKIQEMMNKGIRFHFTRDNLILDEGSSPHELLQFDIQLVFARQYAINLKSEINKGMTQRRAEGWFCGKAPVGYLNIKDPKTKKSIIIVDEQSKDAVEYIFSRYATGNYGLNELAERLSKGLGRKVTKRTIEGMISNPFYYGKLHLKGKVTGEGAHDPLITKELFDRCQKIRGIRASQSARGRWKLMSPDRKKPFMGFIRCGVCNHAVTGEVKRVKQRVYTYYHCANHACGERRKNVREEDLWAMVQQAFYPFKKFTPKATAAFLDTMESKLTDLELYTQKKCGELAERRLEVKKKILEADRLYQKGVLSDEEYEQVAQIRQMALEDINKSAKAYLATDQETFAYGRQVIETFHKASEFMELDNDPMEKVELIRIVLSKLFLEGKTLRFTYQKPFDVLTEMVGVPVWWRRRESNPRPNVGKQRLLHA